MLNPRPLLLLKKKKKNPMHHHKKIKTIYNLLFTFSSSTSPLFFSHLISSAAWDAHFQGSATLTLSMSMPFLRYIALSSSLTSSSPLSLLFLCSPLYSTKQVQGLLHCPPLSWNFQHHYHQVLFKHQNFDNPSFGAESFTLVV